MTDTNNLPVSELKANDTVYDIVGKSVIDQNNTTHLKMWSGTKAEYDALEIIDESTMYLIKDDVEPLNSQTLFDCKWLDYAVDSLCWKNANDFAWISGDIYKDAYEHLVEDVNEKSADNSDTIGSYTIWYVLADDGHKIVGPDQATAAENIYNESGVAWYYILDKNNHRFKLPRINPAREELIQVVRAKGDGTSIGLENSGGKSGLVINANYNLQSYNTAYGQPTNILGGGSESGSGVNLNSGITTDSTKSGIISDMTDSTSVYKGNKYLYFFVGNLIVNQYEIDANGYATKHLDNLSSIGKNIANWSSNVTNCITEIPQDIKLELSEGVLTLKAGSKVYVPNGFEEDGTTPKFDVVTIESDISVSSWGGGMTDTMMFVRNGVNFTGEQVAYIYSGNYQPTVGNLTAVWYDTTDNLIKHTDDTGSNWTSNSDSLPFCIIHRNSGAITGIDQVFNGLGYIGSTIFVLPGVKGLIPNGRNTDGSLKNISITTNKVYARTVTWEQTTIGEISLATNSQFYWNILDYNEKENLNYDQHGNLSRGTTIGYFTSDSSSNHKISYFNPKTPFHALDYNDKGTIAGWTMPSNKYIDLTLGASGDTYTAPANGYFQFSKNGGADADNYIQLENTTNGLSTRSYGLHTNHAARGYLPAKKGDIVKAFYTATGTTVCFRFIYAKGEI